MKNVLVTAIGSFSADIVIKNLIAEGIRVIGCDIYPSEWIVDSANVSAFYQVPYATDEEAYVEKVLSICRKEEIDGLVILTDVEVDVWNLRRKELEAEGITLCLSSEKTVDLCRDKEKFYHFFKEQGFDFVIPTYRLNEISEEMLDYPLVVKPYNGRSSQGLHYINSEQELLHLVHLVKRETRGSVEDYIVQPMIRGPVITVDIVRQPETGGFVAVSRKELLRTLNGAGTSVLVFHDEQLEEICRLAADALDIRGCVNFEFIKSADDKYYILECNPRFSGGVEFSCMAGYDCISNHIKCFDGRTMEPAGEIASVYIARKYEEYITGVLDDTLK
jgi:carbamoyl-phosphate synthase large subunit